MSSGSRRKSFKDAPRSLLLRSHILLWTGVSASPHRSILAGRRGTLHRGWRESFKREPVIWHKKRQAIAVSP